MAVVDTGAVLMCTAEPERKRGAMSDNRTVIERVQDLVAAADRIVVLTGAGISADAGIPDFRGPNGLWTKNPKAEKMSNIEYYLNDPEVRELAWRSRLESAAWEARPTAGHSAIVALQDDDGLMAQARERMGRCTTRAAGTARTAFRWETRSCGCVPARPTPSV